MSIALARTKWELANSRSDMSYSFPEPGTDLGTFRSVLGMFQKVLLFSLIMFFSWDFFSFLSTVILCPFSFLLIRDLTTNQKIHIRISFETLWIFWKIMKILMNSRTFGWITGKSLNLSTLFEFVNIFFESQTFLYSWKSCELVNNLSYSWINFLLRGHFKLKNIFKNPKHFCRFMNKFK